MMISRLTGGRSVNRRAIPTVAVLSLVALFIAAMSSVALAVPPANDDCTDATNIGLGDFPFTTAQATSAGPGVCVNFGKDIWFKHRARFTGSLLVSTCDNATFDTVITVYRGTSCNDNTLIANMIGCNDDANGCSGHTSKLTVNVTKDQIYLIRIGGFNADSGTGVLTVACGDQESAACASIIKTGDAAEDRFGYAIARGGLKNADNFADVLVGAYLNDTAGLNAGQAVAFQGGDLSSLYTKNGEVAGDNFGFSVATGDITGDGRDDFIIGAPLNDEAGANAGKVYAFDGFDGSLLWTQVGQAAGDRFGYSVGFAGDIDNDGFGDVIVGAPFNDGNGASSGRAYILDGENGNRLRTHTGQAAGDQFGFAVAGATDLNDDGKADYAIGAPRNDTVANDAGRVTIFNGANGAVLIRLDGDAAGDHFGSSIASDRFTAGFDYTFIVVGSPFNDAGGSNAGRARVFFRNHDFPGESGCNKIVCLRYTINGSNAGGRLGSSVALGDLVGNAADDIIVGAPFTSSVGNNAGAAYVFDGNGGALSMRFFGEAAGDRFGTAVAFGGDIDNDGANDLVVGGPFNDSGGANAGRAYAFLFGSALLKSASPGGAAEIAGGGNAGAPALSKVVGDATLDGVVNSADLVAVVSAWGPCAVAPGAMCPADVNRDGRVDVDDLMLVLASWPR